VTGTMTSDTPTGRSTPVRRGRVQAPPPETWSELEDSATGPAVDVADPVIDPATDPSIVGRRRPTPGPAAGARQPEPLGPDDPSVVGRRPPRRTLARAVEEHTRRTRRLTPPSSGGPKAAEASPRQTPPSARPAPEAWPAPDVQPEPHIASTPEGSRPAPTRRPPAPSSHPRAQTAAAVRPPSPAGQASPVARTPSQTGPAAQAPHEIRQAPPDPRRARPATPAKAPSARRADTPAPSTSARRADTPAKAPSARRGAAPRVARPPLGGPQFAGPQLAGAYAGQSAYAAQPYLAPPPVARPPAAPPQAAPAPVAPPVPQPPPGAPVVVSRRPPVRVAPVTVPVQPDRRIRRPHPVVVILGALIWTGLLLATFDMAPIALGIAVTPVTAIAALSAWKAVIRAANERAERGERAGGADRVDRTQRTSLRPFSLLGIGVLGLAPVGAAAGPLVLLLWLAAGAGLVLWQESDRPSATLRHGLLAAVAPAVGAGALVLADRQGPQVAMILIAAICLWDVSNAAMGNGRSGGLLGAVAGLASVLVLAKMVNVLFSPPFVGHSAWLLCGAVAVVAPLGVGLCQRLAPGRLPALRRIDSLVIAAPVWVLGVAVLLHGHGA